LPPARARWPRSGGTSSKRRVCDCCRGGACPRRETNRRVSTFSQGLAT
jgi:hypothetical protein